MVGPLTSSRSKYKDILVVLLSVIGLSLLALSMLATMASAQPSSNSVPASSSNSIGSSDTTVKQMGICQVGVKSPCNGNSVE